MAVQTGTIGLQAGEQVRGSIQVMGAPSFMLEPRLRRQCAAGQDSPF